MATSADEFDPPDGILTSVIDQGIQPALSLLSREIGQPYVAKISIWVRDQEFRKYSLSADGRSDYDVEENTVVRIRFRRTHRDNRVLVRFETQHAEVWRTTGFSGVRCRGDVRLIGNETIVRISSKTLCYDQGWGRGW